MSLLFEVQKPRLGSLEGCFVRQLVVLVLCCLFAPFWGPGHNKQVVVRLVSDFPTFFSSLHSFAFEIPEKELVCGNEGPDHPPSLSNHHLSVHTVLEIARGESASTTNFVWNGVHANFVELE